MDHADDANGRDDVLARLARVQSNGGDGGSDCKLWLYLAVDSFILSSSDGLGVTVKVM